MKIAIIGTGYVGLVTGACLSEYGFDVWCVDKDDAKIANLKLGVMPIYEPGLADLVVTNADGNRLHFTTSTAEAVAGAAAVFIAVGTPQAQGSADPDLSFVDQAAAEIARQLTGYTVVVTKSTVPVGTARRVAGIIRRLRPDAEVDCVSNPEFLREGSAVGDFMRPDRVVIGADSERALKVMRRLYRPLFLIGCPIDEMSPETAELTKYASNAFLATKVTFINEIADLCEAVDADVQMVAKSLGRDGRIGPKFLHAGPGFGGSCFPKDTRAFAAIGRRFGVGQRIVESVIRVNDVRKRRMAERILRACGGSLRGKVIAVLGLTFKPNTDDLRESVALDVVPGLLARGAAVRVFDPAGMPQARRLLDTRVSFCHDAYEAAQGAAAVVILTEWNQFRSLDFPRLAEVMRDRLVIDLRNIYRPEEVTAAGFTYHSVGRAIALPTMPSDSAICHADTYR